MVSGLREPSLYVVVACPSSFACIRAYISTVRFMSSVVPKICILCQYTVQSTSPWSIILSQTYSFFRPLPALPRTQP